MKPNAKCRECGKLFYSYHYDDDICDECVRAKEGGQGVGFEVVDGYEGEE